MTLHNLEEGLTLKKRLLVVLFAEMLKEPIGFPPEEGFTPENYQQLRDEMAEETFNSVSLSGDEWISLSKKDHYSGVDPYGANIQHTLTSDLEMEELQSSEGHCTSVLKIKMEDFEEVFKPLGPGWNYQ
ncbi:unnamed protein product [Ambrosiozyma monospora]|uniref:Unnamed protein product n=1 Tax=Ambrosiozyma monospora TaxID=43982 RepID=A0ACB5T5C0_AMBMO|nr:unnamed protein product [Ambrosiozyma monospora]